MISQESIFFHEDDYCQLEIVPAQSLSDWVLSTSYLKEKSILISDYELIIKHYALYFFEKIYTGYGSAYRAYRPSIRAYGYENYVLYFEFEKNIIVRSWLSYHHLSNLSDVFPKSLESVLNEIGNAYNLMLIDQREFQSVNLKNDEELHEYLIKIIE